MLKLLLVIAALFALLAAYAVYGRPLLEKAGILSPLPGDPVGAWDRVLAFGRRSLTLGWSWIVGIVSASAGIAGGLLGDPDLQGHVKAFFSDPKYLALVGIVFAVITYLARRRTA